jgi:glucose-6-phosphate 1-dehydrogenase
MKMDRQSSVYDGAAILLFGATGDLARRKLFPAIYSLYKEKKLSERFAVIGLARRPRTREEFHRDVLESIREFARHEVSDDEAFRQFVEHFTYMSLNTNDVEGFARLREVTEELEAKFNLTGNRLFYLALAPELFGGVSENLRAGGLLDSPGWHRLVIEKPFGYDLRSAEALNDQIRKVFKEEEIYRIDHYLGKEMVQNFQVIRFANAFFEPLWNHRYIANIQITLSETVGVEDRGGYYEQAGALRDMGQNHILQMVAMMAMEPPSSLEPEHIRDEKVKALRSLRLYQSPEEVARSVVRGQYTAGNLKGKPVPAYREEDKVDPASNTETYFAAKIFVDNLRWAGVPFYVRTGKRLPAKATEVVVEFKNLPGNMLFHANNRLEPNLLVFRVNPDEGIYFKINAKKPGAESELVPVALDFSQSSQVGINTPEAYERLLYDAIKGDSTYFTRWDEVALAWRFVDRIAEAWRSGADDLEMYAAGSWGPAGSFRLVEQDGFKWWPVNGQREGESVWVTNHPV